VRVVVAGAGFAGLLAAHLAGHLGTSVRLRNAVRSVEYDREQVWLLTDDGEVRGDAVILAVPRRPAGPAVPPATSSMICSSRPVRPPAARARVVSLTAGIFRSDPMLTDAFPVSLADHDPHRGAVSQARSGRRRHDWHPSSARIFSPWFCEDREMEPAGQARLAMAGVTAREAEILAVIGGRLTNQEIAGQLFISVRTVESHVSALLRKPATCGYWSRPPD
jgi:DNA-binding CsgD family transcriptional regulator